THPLTIGQTTYIQVRAHLDTTHAHLTIGSGCVVGEFASVGLKNSDKDVEGKVNVIDDGGDGSGGAGEEGVEVEDHVVIDAKVVVEEGCTIGEGTVIECGARIGRGARVGKYCKIAPLCSVAPGEVLPDYTVIYGFNERRIDHSKPEAARAKAAEALVEVLKKAEMAIRAAQSARKGGN
ncbi:MAG: hypothetical protein Q9203_003819, partial [Teloschistes exilis]